MRKIASLLLAALLVVSLSSCHKASAKTAVPGKTAMDKVKAGFIYIGPAADYGFSYAHEVGRRYVKGLHKDWLTTIYQESVPEAEVGKVIDRMILEEKCDVVFTTSFGYMDETIAAGARYPDKLFMHCSGFKQSANVGTYFSELYQVYYLCGLMAGALTRTGTAGYVAAFPTSEVIRHINAFALGLKATNPTVKLKVRWLMAWYDPYKAKESAEALVASGADCLAFTEDSPAVLQVAEEHTKKGKPVYGFSHYSPMQSYAPDACVSGEIVDWGIMYDKILLDIKNGTWSNADMWWRVGEQAALLGGAMGEPINPLFVDALKKQKVVAPDLGKISVYDLVMKRYDQMKNLSFEPFTGPITSQDGSEKIPEGRTASKDDLLMMNYFVDNVVGGIPANN